MLQETARLPPWLEHQPLATTNADTTSSVRKAATKQIKNQIRRDGLVTTKSRDVYMQINLQDLEAYTQDVLQAERARRRKCWLHIGMVLSGLCGLIGLGYWIVTGDINVHLNALLASSQHGGSGNAGTEYPLLACEQQLNHNQSFQQLFWSIHDHPDEQPQCRPMVSICDHFLGGILGFTIQIKPMLTPPPCTIPF